MKKLFLASSVSVVAPDIAKHLPAKGLKLVFIQYLSVENDKYEIIDVSKQA